MRPQFANNEIYHVYNRGVEKRDVFTDKRDYFRFIHDLFEFNDKSPALDSYYKSSILKSYQSTDQPSEVSPRRVEQQLQRIAEIKKEKNKPRKLLVEILCWCLMPNHFHLLLRQLVDGGVSLFMKKLGTGYTLYFNQKHERSGVLFQGVFKAVLVKDEEHLLHLPFYIHANPLDFIEPRWREGQIKDFRQAWKYLSSFRYSSHLDFLGQKNFPSVSQRNLLLEVLGGTTNYQKNFFNWLKSMNEQQLRRFSATALDY